MNKQTIELRKSKRSLSSSKKGKSSRNKNKADLLQVYGGSQTNRKSSKKQKVKITKHHKREETQDYQFPEFSIAFKDHVRVSTSESCLNDEIKSSKIQSANKSTMLKKKEKESKSNIDARNAKLKNSKKFKNLNESSFLNYANSKSNDQALSPLQKNYLKCVEKVFNILDVFNKRVISQANINKWVPQPALYFLGKVFQKIRTQRLSLSLQEFKNLCIEVFRQSSFQDIQWFFEQIIKIDQKQSTKLTQKQLFQLSPIEKRMIEEELLRNSSKSKLNYRNLPHQQLMTLVKAKRNTSKRTDDRLTEAKEDRRYMAFNILEQQKSDHQKNSFQRDQFSKINKISSFINICGFQEGGQNTMPNKKTVLKNRLEIVDENAFYPVNVYPVNVENTRFANFKFQLPQSSAQSSFNASNSQNKSQSNSIHHKLEDIYNQPKNKLQSTTKLQRQQLSSDRCQPNNRSYLQPEKAIEAFGRNADGDSQRLDLLRSKIDSFIKQNAQKIQKNKSFYLQNCPKWC